MSDQLTDRVRAALAKQPFTEQRMFGGIAFMIDGKMIASASKRGLLVRVGKDGQAQALKDPQVKQPAMGKRLMSGYVRVQEAGLSDAALDRWLGMGLAVVRAMKSPAAAPSARGAKPQPTSGRGRVPRKRP